LEHKFRDSEVKTNVLASFSYKSNTILNNPKDNEVKANALASYCSLEYGNGVKIILSWLFLFITEKCRKTDQEQSFENAARVHFDRYPAEG